MITIQLLNSDRLLKKIAALQLNPAQRMQLNRRLGETVAQFSRDRISQQRTVNGSRFVPRKRGKGAMLLGLRDRMQVVPSGSESKVSWRGGRVAYAHQYGFTETMTAKRLQEQERRFTRASVSQSQAVALLQSGYKRPDGTRPSTGWIRANLSSRQAGVMIRALRGAKKQSWSVSVPARPFLGVNARDIHVLQAMVLNELGV